MPSAFMSKIYAKLGKTPDKRREGGESDVGPNGMAVQAGATAARESYAVNVVNPPEAPAPATKLKG